MLPSGMLLMTAVMECLKHAGLGSVGDGSLVYLVHEYNIHVCMLSELAK